MSRTKVNRKKMPRKSSIRVKGFFRVGLFEALNKGKGTCSRSVVSLVVNSLLCVVCTLQTIFC